MPATTRAALACAAALASACAEDGETGVLEPVPILEPARLAPVDEARDPLAQHRPAYVDCPAGAWGPEGTGFEIQTGVCNYAAFDQPVPMTLQAGDALELTIWHDLLDAPEPATAHLALWLDSTVLWEAEVDIPAQSAQIEAMVPVDFDPRPDARVGIHLHNHGYNSWRVVALDVHPR